MSNADDLLIFFSNDFFGKFDEVVPKFGLAFKLIFV